MTKENYKKKYLELKKNKVLSTIMQYLFIGIIIQFVLFIIVPSIRNPYLLVTITISIIITFFIFGLSNLYSLYIAYKAEYIEYLIGTRHHRKLKQQEGEKAQKLTVQGMFFMIIWLIFPTIILFLFIYGVIS